jgi:broad specificity phosphatase PhoE
MTNYNQRRRLSGQHNTVLTEAGRVQAVQLASSLPPGLNLIACSTLARAIETMELAIGEARLRGPVFIDPRLNEVNFGRFQGSRQSSIGELSRRDIAYVPDGGESYRLAAARIFSFLVDLGSELAVNEAERTTSAVFCHAGVLRILSTLITPAEDPAEMFARRFDNVSGFELCLREVRLPAFWVDNLQSSRP